MLAHLLRDPAFIAASCVRARRHGHVDQTRAVTREADLERGCELPGILNPRPVDAEACGVRKLGFATNLGNPSFGPACVTVVIDDRVCVVAQYCK
jgi:hypothetical protein